METQTTLNAQEFARETGVSRAAVYGWLRAGRLRGAVRRGREWAIPCAEIERIRNEVASYRDQHAVKLAAAEQLAEYCGAQSGLTLRAATETAEQLVGLAADWTARGQAGATAEATRELEEGVRQRIAVIAALHSRLNTLAELARAVVEGLPKSPRNQLLLILVRGGIEPAEARQLVDRLSDEEVDSRLAEAPRLGLTTPDMENET